MSKVTSRRKKGKNYHRLQIEDWRRGIVFAVREASEEGQRCQVFHIRERCQESLTFVVAEPKVWGRALYSGVLLGSEGWRMGAFNTRTIKL